MQLRKRALAFDKHHAAFVGRHHVLRSMEGWFTIVAPINNIYYNEWLASGSKVKATRWISRKYPELTQEYLSVLGEQIASSVVSFKLSCRHNDILRASETPHFNSCFRYGSYPGKQCLRYAEDPDVGVLYSPDSAGKFKLRAWIRLVDEGRGIVVGRPYGKWTGELYEALCKHLLTLPKIKSVYHYCSYYGGSFWNRVPATAISATQMSRKPVQYSDIGEEIMGNVLLCKAAKYNTKKA